MQTFQRRTVVSGPNTTGGDHKVVLLDHTAGSPNTEPIRQQSAAGRRKEAGDIIHFRFVVGDNFDSFSGSHASIYAARNPEGRALQVNPLLETEGGEVLGILVQYLSVENLVAVRKVQPSS